MTRRLGRSLVAVALLAGTALVSQAGAAGPAGAAVSPPPVRHVFVINLENKGFDETWGPGSKAPYLSKTLRKQGVLLTQYYGTAHNSLPNYIAQISGQAPDKQTQGDCQVYSAFVQPPAPAPDTVAPGQAIGEGCVYPKSVLSLPVQLTNHGLSWKGYMQDMGTPCRHPALNSQDGTQKAKVGDQYAARHNPFVYFQGVTDTTQCAQRDVDLKALPNDLASVATTPNLTYITPNLCNDAHDSPCVDGRQGGLPAADYWLKTWVPRIMNSPAFKKDGLLLITFDESDGPQSDSSACCGEVAGPNSPQPGIVGPGGGRVGGLAISPFIRPGTSTLTAYNHYALLASIEDLFGLPRLGYAKQANPFGSDVYNGH